jgi:hypothetical protein
MIDRVSSFLDMFCLTLPAAELCPKGSLATAEYQGVTTTITARSR